MALSPTLERKMVLQVLVFWKAPKICILSRMSTFPQM